MAPCAQKAGGHDKTTAPRLLAQLTAYATAALTKGRDMPAESSNRET
jgi:hypothetical protein